MPNLTENSVKCIIMVMCEFNSLDDWALVNQQLRGQIRPLYNQQHRRQLFKMHDNLYHSVTELSRCEVDYRRTHNSTQYLEQLAKCKQQLLELQQWLMFATLLDTKSEE
jgi:hypothetical protein